MTACDYLAGGMLVAALLLIGSMVREVFLSQEIDDG